LNPHQPEISDLVVQHDPETLKRLPVNKREYWGFSKDSPMCERYASSSEFRATDGFLESAAVDRMMLAVHWKCSAWPKSFITGIACSGLCAPRLTLCGRMAPQDQSGLSTSGADRLHHSLVGGTYSLAAEKR